MCDQRVVLIEKGQENLVMEAVDRMEVVTDGVRVTNIFGEEKIVAATFQSWSNNKMVLQPQV